MADCLTCSGPPRSSDSRKLQAVCSSSAPSTPGLAFFNPGLRCRQPPCKRHPHRPRPALAGRQQSAPPGRAAMRQRAPARGERRLGSHPRCTIHLGVPGPEWQARQVPLRNATAPWEPSGNRPQAAGGCAFLRLTAHFLSPVKPPPALSWGFPRPHGWSPSFSPLGPHRPSGRQPQRSWEAKGRPCRLRPDPPKAPASPRKRRKVQVFTPAPLGPRSMPLLSVTVLPAPAASPQTHQHRSGPGLWQVLAPLPGPLPQPARGLFPHPLPSCSKAPRSVRAHQATSPPRDPPHDTCPRNSHPASLLCSDGSPTF